MMVINDMGFEHVHLKVAKQHLGKSEKQKKNLSIVFGILFKYWCTNISYSPVYLLLVFQQELIKCSLWQSGRIGFVKRCQFVYYLWPVLPAHTIHVCIQMP
eukprot:3373346-Karenia_brevis.AAC.1